jgi:hypothetical protein
MQRLSVAAGTILERKGEEDYVVAKIDIERRLADAGAVQRPSGQWWWRGER